MARSCHQIRWGYFDWNIIFEERSLILGKRYYLSMRKVGGWKKNVILTWQYSKWAYLKIFWSCTHLRLWPWIWHQPARCVIIFSIAQMYTLSKAEDGCLGPFRIGLWRLKYDWGKKWQWTEEFCQWGPMVVSYGIQVA